jgi:TDG/mug DNA glycosylase family protein
MSENTARLRGFPPSVGARLTVLILGSFPGVRSLGAHEYYAHPHNRFWRAVAHAAGTESHAPYARRLEALHRAGIGLWDVLASCDRRGSLDQAIIAGTEVPNDLGRIVGAHPELRAILLNGATAGRLLHRCVLPRALWPDAGVSIVTMPSTSPAHAAASPEAIIAAWEATLRRFLTPDAV